MNAGSGFTLDPSKFVYMGQGKRRNFHYLTWFPLLSQGILEAFLMDFFLTHCQHFMLMLKRHTSRQQEPRSTQ